MDMIFSNQEYAKAEYEFNMFIDASHCELAATEAVASGGVLDTITKILTSLKHFVKQIIMSIIETVKNQFRYDMRIKDFNNSLVKDVSKRYNKCSVEQRININAVMREYSVGSCWNKQDFMTMLSDFEGACNLTSTTLVNKLHGDVENLFRDASWSDIVDDLYRQIGFVYHTNTGQVSFEPKLSYENGATVGELGFETMDDMFNLSIKYNSIMNAYTSVTKLPSVLMNIEKSLDIQISNIKNDITISDSTKEDTKHMSEQVKQGIVFVKNLIDRMRSLFTEISRRFNMLFTKAHAAIRKEIDKKD